jgi:hypothetical protein
MRDDRRQVVELGATLSDDKRCPISARESRRTDGQLTTCPRSRFDKAATRRAQLVAVGLATLAGRRPGNGFRILMYHRVGDRPREVETPTVNGTPGRLGQQPQLEGLLSRGFQAWPLRRALEAFRASRPVPPNVFVVTLDDGYENNPVHALPIFEELRIPSTEWHCDCLAEHLNPNRN